MIYADIQWREQYVSHALNRKFTGVIPTGIYQGFECSADGNRIKVGTGSENTAVAETHGYSITLRMTEPEYVMPSEGAPYIVLEARYQPGVATTAKLAAVAKPEPHHIVLCHVTDNGTGWTVDTSERSLARIIRMDIALAQMAEAQIEQMERHLALRDKAEADANQARKDAQATARSLASDLHARITGVERHQEGVNDAQQEVNAEQAEQNAASTLALVKTATASIATMTRQVSMLDRLLAVEKAAGT